MPYYYLRNMLCDICEPVDSHVLLVSIYVIRLGIIPLAIHKIFYPEFTALHCIIGRHSPALTTDSSRWLNFTHYTGSFLEILLTHNFMPHDRSFLITSIVRCLHIHVLWFSTMYAVRDTRKRTISLSFIFRQGSLVFSTIRTASTNK